MERYGKDTIRGRVFKMAQENKQPVQEPQKESNFLVLFLGFCILFLSCAMFVAAIQKYGMPDWKVKDNPKIVSVASKNIVTPKPEVIYPVYPKEEYLSRSDGEEMARTFSMRIEELESQYGLWNERWWLMGIAINENANLSKGVDRRYHPQHQPKYMTFDKFWKINKLPETMGLTEEEKQRFRKYLR